MGTIKHSFTPAFKARVALDLIKDTDTIAAICSRYGIHPTQAGKWKQQVLAGLELNFSGKPLDELKAKDVIIAELYQQIGQLKVELDWLKKKLSVE